MNSIHGRTQQPRVAAQLMNKSQTDKTILMHTHTDRSNNVRKDAWWMSTVSISIQVFGHIPRAMTESLFYDHIVF